MNIQPKPLKPKMRQARSGLWFCIGGGVRTFAHTQSNAYYGWKARVARDAAKRTAS